MPEGLQLETSEAVIHAHPELHEPYPEKVDNVVTEWVLRQREVTTFSDAELEDWGNEFALVEQEHLDPHPVNIRTIEAAVRKLQTIAEQSGATKVQEVAVRTKNLAEVIRRAIGEYAATVRHHSRVSQEMGFRDDPAARLRAANVNRSKAHEYLIDALETYRSVVQGETAQLGIKRDLPAHATFEKRQLSTKGVARESLGHWALDMDIAIKARTLEESIAVELENRKKPDEALS